MSKTISVQYPLSCGIVSEIPSTTPIETDTFKVSIESITQEKDKITINVEVFPPLVKTAEKKSRIYDQTLLKSYQAAFIGRVFLLFSDNKNNYRKKAREFLQKAIQHGIESCRPLYYILKENLLEKNEYLNAHDIYMAIGMRDTFPNFFYKLYLHIRNKNISQAISFIEMGSNKFPNNSTLFVTLREYLEKNGEFEKLLMLLKESESLNTTWYDECIQSETYLSLYLKCYLHLGGHFNEAEKFLESVHMRFSVINFWKGVLYFADKKNDKLVEYFEKATDTDHDTEDITEASYYYLLNYYLEKKDINKIKDTIRKLNPEFEKGYFIKLLDFYYGDIAENTLRGIIENYNIAELAKERAKAKGLLAYLIKQKKLPEIANISEKKCFIKINPQQSKDINSALEYIQGCLDYYPENEFFNGLHKDLLSYKNNSDESCKNALKTISVSDKSEVVNHSAQTTTREGKKIPNAVKKLNLSYESNIGLMRYGDEIYKFRGARSKILNVLWNTKQKENINGKLPQDLKFARIPFLARIAGFITQETEYDDSKKDPVEKKVRDAIKGLNNRFRDNKLPIEIVTHNKTFILIVKSTG
ncbi:MAG: hypothetical protein WC947_09565 [Elusimicrobiota bacterium]